MLCNQHGLLVTGEPCDNISCLPLEGCNEFRAYVEILKCHLRSRKNFSGNVISQVSPLASGVAPAEAGAMPELPRAWE